jgi:hypothetical protein
LAGPLVTTGDAAIQTSHFFLSLSLLFFPVETNTFAIIIVHKQNSP